MKPETQATPTPLRLPDDLKIWLKHQAIDNHRSLNNELVHRLKQSRDQQQSQGPAQ